MAAGSPRSCRSFLSSTLACLLRPLYRQRSRARFTAAHLPIAFFARLIYETFHKSPTVRYGAHCKLHTRLSRDRSLRECRSRGKNGVFSSELPEALLLRTPPNNGHHRRYARKRALSFDTLLVFARVVIPYVPHGRTEDRRENARRFVCSPRDAGFEDLQREREREREREKERKRERT